MQHTLTFTGENIDATVKVPTNTLLADAAHLAGVEIGPRTIVGANSVVSASLPPEQSWKHSPTRAGRLPSLTAITSPTCSPHGRR